MHPSDKDDAAQVEMPRYQSHKKVWALEIAKVEGHKLTFKDEGYAPIECNPVLFLRGTPGPGDFLVVYEDGYQSFSPAKAFNEGYTRIV